MSAYKSSEGVGLEIRSDEIRLFSLGWVEEHYTVRHWVQRALPPGAVLDGQLKEPALVQTILRQLVQEIDVSQGSVVLAMPASAVIHQRIQLPRQLSVSACEQEIHRQLTRYFPNMREALCFDFHILSASAVGPQEVVVFAARRAQVAAYAELVQQLGLNLRILDVDRYAFVRTVLFGLPQPIRSPLAVLWVDQTQTQFLVYQDAYVTFHQVWPGVAPHFIEMQLKRVKFHLQTLQKSGALADVVIMGSTLLSDDFFQQELSWRVHKTHPLSKLQVVADTLATPLDAAMSDWLTVCGLALRGLSYVEY